MLRSPSVCRLVQAVSATSSRTATVRRRLPEFAKARRSYSSPSPNNNASLSRTTGVTILLTSAATLVLSHLWYQRAPVLAESCDPDQLRKVQPADIGSEKAQYAGAKETQRVIELLRSKLGEDQVTTNPDELLSHGVSANTYHGE
jgi:thiamine pyrophosphate-dependent acetolactate synthase large subunit-like protein